MKIPVNLLNRLSFLYLSLPLLIFLLFWLNKLYAFISVSALICILFYIFKNRNNNDEALSDIKNKNIETRNEPYKNCSKEQNLEIDKTLLIETIGIAVVWCFLSGIGNLFYQNAPFWNYNNALMHDLIQFSWPVIYDNGSALVYWAGFLLPSALFGKALCFLGFQHSIAFKFANYFELLWAAFGISLLFLNLYSLIKAKNSNKLFICFLFILFSGIDILLKINNVTSMSIEYHYNHCNYPAIITQLMFFSNEIICVWLIISLFLKNIKDITNFGLYSILTFFYSPLSFIGIVFYFIIISFLEFFKSIKEKSCKIIKSIFNIKNILSLLVIFPLIIMFYANNFLIQNINITLTEYNPNLITDIIFESIIFLLLLLTANYKNPVYWIMFIYLIISPFYNNNIMSEVIKGDIIPSYTILAILTVQLMMTNPKDKKDKLCKILIITSFVFGAFTPVCEISRSMITTHLRDYNKEPVIKDEIYTFNNKIKEYIGDNQYNFNNYGVITPKEDIFWKYVASEHLKQEEK